MRHQSRDRYYIELVFDFQSTITTIFIHFSSVEFSPHVSILTVFILSCQLVPLLVKCLNQFVEARFVC